MNQTEGPDGQNDTPRRRVSFSDVAIREFDITFVRAGQDARKGLGLSLDWFFTERPTESITEYEKRRRSTRRSHSALLLGTNERRRRLVEDFGFSPADLDNASKRIFLVRSSSAPTPMLATRTRGTSLQARSQQPSSPHGVEERGGVAQIPPRQNGKRGGFMLCDETKQVKVPSGLFLATAGSEGTVTLFDSLLLMTTTKTAS
jgi:hypothetical protein